MKLKSISMSLLLLMIIGCESNKSKSKKEILENSKKLESSVVIPEGVYNIDIDNSIVKWLGRTPVKSHDGVINILEGSFSVNEKSFLKGLVIIDMNTINCTDLSGGGKKNLEGHLKNDDFFSVNTYPQAKISMVSNLIPVDGLIEFQAALEIKGKTNPIIFQSKIEEENGTYKAKGSFSFNRALYDVKYRSKSFFNDLGDKFINDEIEIEIEISTI
jgi:polyisoprenoid-binding protein YceI